MKKFLMVLGMIIVCVMMITVMGCTKGDPVNQELQDGGKMQPGRWQDAITVPIQAGRGAVDCQIGNFQKRALEDSSGYSYIVEAEDNQAGAVFRIAIYKSINPLKDFESTPVYQFLSETTIINGYDADEIVGLREFSAEIRGDAIYIAFIWLFSGNYYPALLRYSITNNTFSTIVRNHAEQLQLDNLLVKTKSIDIAVKGSGPLRDINKDDVCEDKIWVSYLPCTTFNIFDANNRFIRFFFMLNLIYPSLGNSLIMSNVVGSDDISVLTVNDSMGLMSSFDGGDQIYAISSNKPTSSVANVFFMYIFGDSIIYPIVWDSITKTGAKSYYYCVPGIISAIADISSILYDFGTWDACYVDYYNFQIMAKWIRNSAKTGWDLYLGARNQNGIFGGFQILSVDYARLGIADIETELENTGIFPETCISVDENGYIYVYALYPDERNIAVGGGSDPGQIDANPYTSIVMFTFKGDDVFDTSNLNGVKVSDGYFLQKRWKGMSAPHRTDTLDEDTPDVNLFIRVMDILEADPTLRVKVLTRV